LNIRRWAVEGALISGKEEVWGSLVDLNCRLRGKSWGFGVGVSLFISYFGKDDRWWGVEGG